jgi:antirestriction protein ArdC
MSHKTNLRQQVTDQIVKALESDLLPWRRPWSMSKNSGRPANVISKKPYSGVNPLLLELHRLRHGFTSKWYGTYKQWQSIGGQVKKRPDDVPSGQWGSRIVFYRPVRKTVEDRQTGEERDEQFLVAKQYTVFSADQVNGVEQFQGGYDDGEVPQWDGDFSPVEELVEAVGVEVRHGGDKAFYTLPTPIGSWPNHKDGDYITMPPKHRFNPAGAYYETLLHEMAHYSEVRTGWDGEKYGYAMSELVAEIAASYLSTELGVPQGESLENHAAYLKSWLKEMKADPSFIFKASTQASKIADYLLSFVDQEAEQPAAA